MKILNLVYPEKSDIKYKISKFPDGQQQITILEFDSFDSSKIGQEYEIYGPVQIKSRLNNFQDLELIICAAKSLRSLGVKEIHLYVPYFMGARSDRKFEEGSNNYLKDVICPIINSLNFESVTVLDPHSHVLEACLNNFKKESNYGLTKWALGYIDEGMEGNYILISPDAGASHKINFIYEQLKLQNGYKGDIITCSKERDGEGKLTRTVVPISLEDCTKDLIIIDDICDGGRTFINIAKYIKEVHPKSDCKIYLIVTHGIFSGGFDELGKYFDGIYCTNSYSESLYPFYAQKKEQSYFKQLNVF